MGEMSREKKPKRARIEAGSTVEEAEAIRSLAKNLNMSVTEYILYKTLYETNASSGSTLRDIWDELFTISTQLSELILNAKAIAGQSRAAEARKGVYGHIRGNRYRRAASDGCMRRLACNRG